MDIERVTVIDFHAHILPELDHGCDSVQTVQKQLQLAARAKVDVIAATSHFYPHLDTVDGFLRAREEAYCNLQEVLQTIQNAPEIILGAEVLACKGIERMEGLEKLCLEGTKVLLLEMPFTKQWEKSLVDSVCKLVKKYQVVLAHADRYAYDSVKNLVEAGCQIQLNADSICKWSKRRLCRQYLQDGAVVALGSDIHGSKAGYKKFIKAQRILGNNAAQIMKRTKELCRKVEVET